MKEYEDKLNELQSKISTISRKQTTMVLQKEALTYERDVSRRKIPRKPNKAVKKKELLGTNKGRAEVFLK